MSRSPPSPEEGQSSHNLALQKWLLATTSAIEPSTSLNPSLQSKDINTAMARPSFDRKADPLIDHRSMGYLPPPPRNHHHRTPSQSFAEESISDHLFLTNDQGFVQNPFVAEIDRKFPRIPIPPSVLFAYSSMRAKNTVVGDPLHNALFAHQSRNFYDQRPVRLELVSRRHSIDSLPKHTTFFWDPLKEQPRVEIPYVPFDPYKLPPSNTTYEEHLRQFPPTIGKNHYKGDKVWGNFGYVKINGRWVDPDGEGEVADAFKSEDYRDDVAPNLPDLQKSPDLGPRVMSAEEQDAFYSIFSGDVSDEEDGEGDPRNYPIDPATFARWAAGCGTGDKFEEKSFIPSPNVPLTDPEYEATIAPIPPPGQQYDMEDGSILSGLYEPDPNPRLVRHAQGVNIVRPPVALSYSYPQAALDLDNQAFSNGEVFGPAASYASNIKSTPEVFNSEDGLRNILGDFQADNAIYEEARKKVLAAREEFLLRAHQLFKTVETGKTLADQREQLGREVFFLQARLDSRPPPPPPFDAPSATSTATATPANTYHDHLDQPDGPASPSPQPPRRRSQYARYMSEELKRSQIAAAKAQAFANRLGDDHQEILDDITELEGQKQELMHNLGVKSVGELPDLIPLRRSKSVRDLRVQFGLGEGLN